MVENLATTTNGGGDVASGDTPTRRATTILGKVQADGDLHRLCNRSKKRMIRAIMYRNQLRIKPQHVSAVIVM